MEFNPIRQIVIAFCKKKKICTRCFAAYSEEKTSQCEYCLVKRRVYKKRAVTKNPNLNKQYYQKHKEDIKRKAALYRKRKKALVHKETLNKEKIRAKQKEYKRKALVKKVRKLDRIKYAVEKGKEL